MEVVEVSHLNSYSPLRCWSFRSRDAHALGGKRGHFALFLRLFKKREVVLANVQEHGFTLQYADSKLKKDRDVVLAAVSASGNALKFADDEIKKDRKVVLTAVSAEGFALHAADPSLKRDRRLVLRAVIKEGFMALSCADDALQYDPLFVLLCRLIICLIYFKRVASQLALLLFLQLRRDKRSSRSRIIPSSSGGTTSYYAIYPLDSTNIIPSTI